MMEFACVTMVSMPIIVQVIFQICNILLLDQYLKPGYICIFCDNQKYLTLFSPLNQFLATPLPNAMGKEFAELMVPVNARVITTEITVQVRLYPLLN